MTFKATLATVISEVVKEGRFATVDKGMSDELNRFISALMAKARQAQTAYPIKRQTERPEGVWIRHSSGP